MGRIIAVSNGKGGVGKTAVTVNLAAALVEAGQRVLLVDADPQGSATMHLGLDPDKLTRTLATELVGGNLADIVQLGTGGVHIIPANLDLAGAELDMVGLGLPAGVYVLQQALAPLAASFDWVLVDSVPTFGVLALNALVASDQVLIPVGCDYLSMRALSHQLRLIAKARTHYNAGLSVLGIVPTMFDARTNAGTIALEQLRKAMDGQHRVFDTAIRPAVVAKEAPAAGEPLSVYHPQHRLAQAFRDLAKEVMAV